jgi:hypothetical protein
MCNLAATYPYVPGDVWIGCDFKGDVQAGQSRMGHVQHAIQALKANNNRNMQVYSHIVAFTDGTVVTAHRVFNQYSATVYVPIVSANIDMPSDSGSALIVFYEKGGSIRASKVEISGDKIRAKKLNRLIGTRFNGIKGHVPSYSKRVEMTIEIKNGENSGRMKRPVLLFGSPFTITGHGAATTLGYSGNPFGLGSQYRYHIYAIDLTSGLHVLVYSFYSPLGVTIIPSQTEDSPQPHVLVFDINSDGENVYIYQRTETSKYALMSFRLSINNGVMEAIRDRYCLYQNEYEDENSTYLDNSGNLRFINCTYKNQIATYTYVSKNILANTNTVEKEFKSIVITKKEGDVRIYPAISYVCFSDSSHEMYSELFGRVEYLTKEDVVHWDGSITKSPIDQITIYMDSTKKEILKYKQSQALYSNEYYDFNVAGHGAAFIPYPRAYKYDAPFLMLVETEIETGWKTRTINVRLQTPHKEITIGGQMSYQIDETSYEFFQKWFATFGSFGSLLNCEMENGNDIIQGLSYIGFDGEEPFNKETYIFRNGVDITEAMARILSAQESEILGAVYIPTKLNTIFKFF